MEKTIRITGKGEGFYSPDTYEVTMEIEGICKEYELALVEANKKAGALKDAIEKIGFKRDEVKTRRFDTNTEYNQFKEITDGKEVWKKEFKGYRYNQTLVLQFPINRKKLQEVINAIIGTNINPEFRINYILKEKERAKKELLAKAVKDAKEKAEIITEAAGVHIGEIIGMDYSFGRIKFDSPRNFDVDSRAVFARRSLKVSDLEFEPEDIKADDTVTILFSIK